MSLTVAEVMKLPCMREATVVAGHAGLDRLVSSISVSEYTRGGRAKDGRPQGIQLQRIAADLYGNEIVISALASVRNSVEGQCASLQEFHANGSVGLILFYVGIILPGIDPRLINEADALGFPLITMPVDRPDLRYSEVIYEVVEAIIKNRNYTGSLKNDVMESILHNPPHQHNVPAVVRALSDRLHACVLVTGQDGTLMDAAVWPRSFNALIPPFLPQSQTIVIQGVEHAVYSAEVNDPSETGLKLYIFKQGEALDEEVVYRAAETVQIAINLWNPGYGRKAINELLQAILQDEPYKVRLLAKTFHVNLDALRNMWLIRPAQTTTGQRTSGEVVRRAAEELLHLCPVLLTEVYKGYGVLLTSDGLRAKNMHSIGESFVQAQAQAGNPVILTVCSELDDLASIREAFMLNLRNMPLAQTIYPAQYLFSLSEMRFAQRCQSILSSGEGEISQHLRILSPLSSADSDQRLLKTLEVYFFEAGGSVTGTAEIMFLHRNTVQYRLNQVRELLRVSVSKMPEAMDIYVALALRRIMQTSPLHKRGL